MVEIFGEAGKHARFAVGTNSLPRNVRINILSNQKDIGFRTSGSIVIFDGYKKIYTEDVDDNEQDDNKNNNIPRVVEGDDLNFSDVKSLQHFTEPPPMGASVNLIAPSTLMAEVIYLCTFHL